MQITRAVLKRGEIYCADLNPVIGSEQGGIRPVLIIQNDVGNKYSPTIIIAAITSRLEKTNLPTHVQLDDLSSGLERNSIVLLEQIRTIDRARLKELQRTFKSTLHERGGQSLVYQLWIGTIY